MRLARGFSLLEVLVAMAISSVLMISAAKLLPSLQLAVLRQSQHILIQEDVWQLVFTIGKHLERAGYCAGACEGSGLTLSRDGSCLLMRWDANNNGRWESASSTEAEQTGFRLRDNAIETQRGSASCTGVGWERITDPALLKVTDFIVSQIAVPGYAPRFRLALAAVPVRHAGPPLTVTHQVVGNNL